MWGSVSDLNHWIEVEKATRNVVFWMEEEHHFGLKRSPWRREELVRE